ncbi:MAG: DEAD/DEAH box helicase [Methanobacteriota archaeon]
MKTADLACEPKIVERLQELGIRELWPPQAEAAPIALSGKNLVVAVPTASGKTLVGILACLQHALRGGKAMYIVPLRALAQEKYEDLKQYEPLGLKVAISIGDLDRADPRLGDFDVVVCTSEKADSMMRLHAAWLSRLSLIVADEVHLIHDPGRGPTLEVTLARFRKMNPAAQIVALSATIKNSDELAAWLGAAHVKSDWRPVTLREGTLYGKTIQFADREKTPVRSERKDPVAALAEDSLAGGGQCLVFVNTRKSSEKVAEDLVPLVRATLSPDEVRRLAEVAEKVQRGEPSEMERRLARCIAAGTAFHHAGLTNADRVAVEQAYKDRLVKALAATPTLAAGINLPARRVIIRDLKRFDEVLGQVDIPVLEYKQMAGRAGRPKYDRAGEAITIARSLEERSEILATYILGPPERIESKLGNEAALRTHVLASVAAGYVRSWEELLEFVDATFFAHHQDVWVLEDRLRDVLRFLTEAEMVEGEEQLRATKFGSLVSRLYIDPLSGVRLRAALEAAKTRTATPLGLLTAVCSTPDVVAMYIRRSDEWVEEEAILRAEELLQPVPYGDGYEFFLGQFKTARLLLDWIDETTTEDLEKRYGAYPGDIHNKVDAAEWLLHALREMAGLFNRGAIPDVATLLVRIRHGIRAELLPLVRLRGVGRVRARALFAAGYRTRAHLRRSTEADLARVHGIGPALAASIKRQVGEGPEEDEEDVVTAAEPAPVPERRRQTLQDFEAPP